MESVQILDDKSTYHSGDHEVLVEVRNLSKKFAKDLKQSLWIGLKDIVKKSFGIPLKPELTKGEFWAVNDISFELRRGECIGLIGHNGAGKSTLLKILNGLYNPDTGEVVMRGKVGALIELGAGFNPILTGRENIYNNAALLGFDKKEVDEKMPEIIDFSEIGEFLDMPVKNYSSGMKVRLGFAVAAFMNPDVLIIDEVLAVGDLGFKLKCFKKIDEILPGTAVIFVSHSMTQISRICNKILVLDHGIEVYNGENISEGILTYFEYETKNDLEKSVYLDTKKFKIGNYRFNGDNKNEFDVTWNENLLIEFDLEEMQLAKQPYFVIQIFDKEQKPIMVTTYDPGNIPLEKDKMHVKLDLGNINLSAAKYSINVGVFEQFENNLLYKANNIATFIVKHDFVSYAPVLVNMQPTLK